ncbi:UvrD-helicase domain-containing protein [Psychromonas hadalis]|uniref:UvrD-helicase domain-containing protein n=1 Tax=Psychromonas hadalis TaxID=211669 RepID=UPI0003B34755|nr:UvrD-helicase domain-containing protein [Psychromonas hadalis]
MSLTVIAEDFINEENSIQKEIYDSIDKNENIIFNAGAGAGKTYALIESLKYIINNYGSKLQKHNQKVVCITYTNVAVDEIKERLGYSDVADVSTIHEKLWSFIRQHQKELLIVHTNKIKADLQELIRNLNENEDVEIEKTYRTYRNLSAELQASFKDYIIDKKDVFYKAYSRNASGFRGAFNGELECYENILKSVANFKKVVSTIYKIENYKYCLQKIEEKDDDYTAVRYDSKFNSDILHKMLFSHDTLIEYAFEMVKKYDLLKQIIGDCHPFILIDEYQDTSPRVIEIMQLLSAHSLKINHNLFIGYFGDKAQNIYDDGVGSNITSLHSGLRNIKKRFNRRSTSEVISVINKIRADEIEQESIYEDCTGGSVKFYHSQAVNKKEEIDAFVSKYVDEWNINNDKKLHCLVLTNKLIAELSGFAELYSIFSGSQYYKKNFQYINTELLSNDLGKLGVVPSVLYQIIKLKILLENPKTPLTTLLSKEVYSSLSFAELKVLLQQLKLITGDNLNTFLYSIFNLYALGDNNVKKVIHEVIGLDKEKLSYDAFFGYVLDQLNPNLDYEDKTEYNSEKEKLEALFALDIEEYERWYNFINDRQDSEVIYHTYHGTKGIEFNNVIIIMENSFGRDKRKFLNYFSDVIDPSGLGDDAKCKFENTKNLLYVSCSRAIKNLRVLYLDDISTFTAGVEHVFGETHNYTSS